MLIDLGYFLLGLGTFNLMSNIVRYNQALIVTGFYSFIMGVVLINAYDIAVTLTSLGWSSIWLVALFMAIGNLIYYLISSRPHREN